MNIELPKLWYFTKSIENLIWSVKRIGNKLTIYPLVQIQSHTYKKHDKTSDEKRYNLEDSIFDKDLRRQA